jgi:hypothetical protein
VGVVNEIDNFGEINWPEFKKPRFRFYLHDLFWGLRSLGATDMAAMKFGFEALEAILISFKGQLKAQGEIKEGQKFQTPWGKALAVETGNEVVIREGQKEGYCLVIRKDPKAGGVRIYARPDSKVDLTKTYDWLKENDKDGEWFLHSSYRLLLNESRTKPMKPTKLSLQKIMEILKNG